MEILTTACCSLDCLCALNACLSPARCLLSVVAHWRCVHWDWEQLSFRCSTTTSNRGRSNILEAGSGVTSKQGCRLSDWSRSPSSTLLLRHMLRLACPSSSSVFNSALCPFAVTAALATHSYTSSSFLRVRVTSVQSWKSLGSPPSHSPVDTELCSWTHSSILGPNLEGDRL